MGVVLAQDPDRILGTYETEYAGTTAKVEITKDGDIYSARVVWLKDSLGPDGRPLLDEKNPDKSLRDKPLDSVTILRGLRYDTKKDRWSGGKVYDPSRGIVANAVLTFDNPPTLRVKGTLLAISESVYWKKIE